MSMDMEVTRTSSERNAAKAMKRLLELRMRNLGVADGAGFDVVKASEWTSLLGKESVEIVANQIWDPQSCILQARWVLIRHSATTRQPTALELPRFAARFDGKVRADADAGRKGFRSSTELSTKSVCNRTL